MQSSERGRKSRDMKTEKQHLGYDTRGRSNILQCVESDVGGGPGFDTPQTACVRTVELYS